MNLDSNREIHLNPYCIDFQIERLQQQLQDSNTFNFMSFEPIPLPLDPDVTITGIMPEEAYIFKVSN